MKKILLALLFLPMLSLGQPGLRFKIDSLLTNLNSGRYERQDTNRAKLLHEIAYAYLGIDRDSAIAYAKQGLKLSEQLDYKLGQGRCLGFLGDAIGDFNIKLAYYYKALKAFEQGGYDSYSARTLGSVAGVYFNMGQYAMALDYFEKGKALYEKVHNEEGIANSNHSIGATYGNLNKFREALEHESLAVKYFEKIKDQRRIASGYSNMGGCYAGLRQYNTALLYSSRAINLFKSFPNNNYTFANAISDRGYIYFLIANDSISVIHPDSLLPAGRKANFEMALQCYKEAYDLYKKRLDFSPLDILEKLPVISAALGQYKEALEYSRLYHHAKDSMLTQDIRLKVAAEETKRETTLKENQIKINSIEAAGQARERWLFLASGVLLCFVMLLIWNNYKKQKRANASLATANRDILTEKEKADELAANLGESLIQKGALATQLAMAADMKTRFLANISHEIRTPVTLLTGMLELMKDNREEPGTNAKHKNEDMLEVAYNNSRKLQYMVEEILDLSKLETKEVQPKYQKINIPAVFKRMVYAFETLMEKEQLNLQYSEGNVQNIYISADENMLEKIINNLVYNAIKFNEQEGWIRVNLMRSADREWFIFTVNNSGSTVSAADLPHIFERFYQGDSTMAKAQGFGIGLSLVKEFTVLMNGKIEATSREGAGTTFTLQFPIVAEDMALKETEEATEDQQAPTWEHLTERQTVLLVEDNTEMRYYIREVLKDNVNLAEAANGKKALEWLAANKADLVITDLMMPEMGGEEFIANLKKDSVHRKIPAITLTALADTDTRLNMLQLGIDDYIVKPFNASELRARVYNLLHNLHERRQFAAEQMMPDDIVETDEDADLFREKVTAFVLPRLRTIDVSVDELASFLTMSTRQLYRISKKLTGCTPAQLIKEVKLQKAYQLLVGGTIYKIDDVAKQVGFDDANYFSKQFAARFGKRPHEFFK